MRVSGATLRGLGGRPPCLLLELELLGSSLAEKRGGELRRSDPSVFCFVYRMGLMCNLMVASFKILNIHMSASLT